MLFPEPKKLLSSLRVWARYLFIIYHDANTGARLTSRSVPAAATVLWMPSMGIHQVLSGPRGVLRLDPKQTAVVTTLDAREASPHLPPRPFRNGGLVAALLSVVESSGQGHIGVLSHNNLF